MWQVVGQDKTITLLQHSLERNSLAHAYLLAGPPHVGKMTLALNLAQALNCQAAEPPCGECASCRKIASSNHADVQVITLETRENNGAEAKLRTEIGIDQVRQMQHSASLPPFEGRHKIFIIEGAELLSMEAANCLLKTLEEPAGRIIFLLLTVNDKLLPATVVSRCQRLELTPLPAAEIENALHGRWGVDMPKAKLLSRLSHGCLGWALSAVFDDALLSQRAEKVDRVLGIIKADGEERFAYANQLAFQFAQARELVQEVLGLWLDWWRDLLLVKSGCSELVTNADRLDTLVDMAEDYRLGEIKTFIGSIQAAGEQLRLNANPRLVLEVLMLDMPGKEGRGGERLTAPVVAENG